MTERIYFSKLESAGDELEVLLNEHGIQIPPKSVLEDIALAVPRYRAMHNREITVEPTADFRDEHRRMLGFADFAMKILSVREHADFEQLVPHLRLLGDPEKLATDPSQNAPTDPSDQHSHKLFELLIAIGAMRIGSNIRLDHPRVSTGDNPDITFEFEGERWGLPCKVIHSPDRRRYRASVATAIGQIERSPVERGLVMINLKNLFPHDELTPFARESEIAPYETWESEKGWRAVVERFWASFVESLRPHADDIVGEFEGTKAVRRVCNYVHSFCYARVDGQPRMSPFAELQPFVFPGAGRETSAAGSELGAQLNHALQFG